MNADFSERTYTAEVMKTASDTADALKAVLKLTSGPSANLSLQETDGRTVNIYHSYIATPIDYHRSPKLINGSDGQKMQIPRRETIRNVECNLYDIFIGQCENHLIFAVPFHDLAEKVFPKIDRALAGTGTLYQRLNITNMVIGLGAKGRKLVAKVSNDDELLLTVTRCHLAYAGAPNRTPNLQQIQMTGADLGSTPEYKSFIAPVLKQQLTDNAKSEQEMVKALKDEMVPRKSDGRIPLTVTPLVLGFALSLGGVRKATAITDRHGNFKIWIAPGVRRLSRIFSLLNTIEKMEDVSSTTSNIPILQSHSIRAAEG